MKKVNKLKFISIIFIIIILLSTFLFLRYRPGQIVNGYTKFGKTGFKQLELPEEGEEIAIIRTSVGDIKIRLFPDAAPLAVENFKTLAKEGFYNGYTFDRVEEDLLIQVRIIDSTKSIYGGYFEREINNEYYHFTGAVGAAGSYEGNSSSFYIICNSGIEPAYLELMSKVGEEEGYTSGLIEAYRAFGGVPRLDYNYTIFGQVFYGMDTAFEINKRPIVTDTERGIVVTVDPIVIESIEIVPFST